MSQVSKRKLDKEIENEMFIQFWNSLSKIEGPKSASDFFSDLLTNTEKYMLAKRLTCAILLVRNRSATDIRNSIHITYSTIGSVASWVKNAKPGTQQILIQISKEQSWQKIIDQIDALLDKLPPRYGSDWSQAGKKKYEQAIKRSARNNLR
ncbi:MAG: Trp family transcriptional regulator [Candidatus Woesebacteria bacterium]|nr:Trp family transcriptional regulator [Candidatus Woesebacteria bacterium]